MPGFNGTGPQGRGPMTGRGMGFCILQESEDSPGQMKGLAGIQGTPISNMKARKEVTNMPRGDGTGPVGLGPLTGRAASFCAGFPVQGYMNPVVGRAGFYGPITPAVGPYRAGLSCYGVPYYSRSFGLGRGFGRGRGRGCGRGRVRFWW
jgi:hypothetical protein